MEEKNEVESRKRTIMTDEERQQLAEKLDKELEEYLDSLEKKPYTDGWPEDRWEEEMEKHPFFMTKPPEEGEELPPALEGLRQLMYDEDENTPEELATKYKEDGNFNFKCKKYRVAVLCYSEGLRKHCKDNDLNAQLYNNRAAAQFFLKNYRSCLKDCLDALALKKPYDKAQSRAAQCYFYLKKYTECMNLCDDILLKDPSNKEILDLRKRAVTDSKIHERNLRKETAGQRKENKEELLLLSAIIERGINIVKKGQGRLSMDSLEPQSPGGSLSRVHLEGDHLLWPVVFLYPEYKMTDFIQSFHENTTFQEQIDMVFETIPEWDTDGKYTPNNLSVYFEDKQTGKLCKVSTESTLLEALKDKRYTVQAGTPAFLVFVAGSNAEKKYVDG